MSRRAASDPPTRGRSGALRDQAWHPIVLDEMRRRDREHETALKGPSYAGALVPLAPYVSPPDRQPLRPQSEGPLLFRIDAAAEPLSPTG